MSRQKQASAIARQFLNESSRTPDTNGVLEDMKLSRLIRQEVAKLQAEKMTTTWEHVEGAMLELFYKAATAPDAHKHPFILEQCSEFYARAKTLEIMREYAIARRKALNEEQPKPTIDATAITQP